MITKIALLIMGHNSYPWEFRQDVGRSDFQILPRSIRNSRIFFNIHFCVLVCTIRMIVNKIVLRLTDDKWIKSTWSIFTEKAVNYFIFQKIFMLYMYNNGFSSQCHFNITCKPFQSQIIICFFERSLSWSIWF